MGRRILNRKEMRADFDAAERTKTEEGELDETEDVEEEEDDEEEDEEEEGDADAEASDEDEAGDEDDDDEDAPKKKKKKVAKPKAKAAKPKAKPRTRTAKVVRLKAIWGVFSNSNQRVATYEYPKRKEADEHAARLTADKKSTHFVQMVKEPIEEKKEG